MEQQPSEQSNAELAVKLREGIWDFHRDEALARLIESAEKDHALLVGEIMPLRALLERCRDVMDAAWRWDLTKEQEAEYDTVLRDVKAMLRPS